MALTSNENFNHPPFNNILPLRKNVQIVSNENHPLFIAKLLSSNIKKKALQWFIKRTIDIVGATVGVIFISPILLLITLLIKLDSRGPILFKQKRVGLNGKEFYMYKFRTMCVDAEKKLVSIKKHNESNKIMFKMKNDPRITKVGKILRKHSLDELPQLLNVIKGEMSLVGPRPPLVSEIREYKDWHYARLGTIPGLTGMWQVNGRSNIKSFDDVVKLDVYYINNWCLFLDFKLLFQTIPVVLLGKGAA